MKVTLSIAVCTLVVLLQQMQTPTALICSGPSCPAGTSIHTGTCKCTGDRPSTCPRGYTPIVKEHGLCACKKTTAPKCPAEFYLNTRTCSCTISKPPTCPLGSTLYPKTALCTGTAQPKCLSGFDLKDNCECASARIRQCSTGMLSPNGCACEDAVVSTPKCSSGCSLNGACRCESGFQCYSGRYCSGSVTGASNSFSCCYGIYNQYEQRSYRNGAGGCVSCPYLSPVDSVEELQPALG